MHSYNTETERRFSTAWLPFLMAAVFLIITGRAAGAKTVTDQLGREVPVAENPQKIVSLAPSITEIVFALGQEERLVGVTKYSDYPQAAKKLPRIGTYVHLDLERVVALQPDLCIAIKDGNPRSVIEKLESLGIPVYAVDPRDLDSVMETTLEIGALLSAEQQAARLVTGMRTRVQRIKTRVKQADFIPKVFFQIGISPVVSVGTNTFIHDLIVSAGGENLSKGPVPYPRPTKEQIISLCPDIFIITSMERGEAFEQVKASWRRWPHIPAVKNDRIFLVDSNIFDRPSPRLVDGLELLAKLIHPELFDNADKE